MAGHDSTSAHATHPLYPVVFYDGECGFCHTTVRFAIARDRSGELRYAPLSGETYQRLRAQWDNLAGADSARVEAFDWNDPPNTLLVATESHDLLVRSRAVLYVLGYLKAPWPSVGRILEIVPTPITDLGYRVLAAMRHRLFSRPEGLCPIVPAAKRSKFLP